LVKLLYYVGLWQYGLFNQTIFCAVAFYFCVDLLILSVTEFELEYGGILYSWNECSGM